MPFLDIPPRVTRGKKGEAADSEPVKIFYKTYGQGDCKIIMIMGVAATNTAWWPQLKPLTGTETPNEPEEFTDNTENEFVKSTNGGQDSADVEAHMTDNMRAASDLSHRLMLHSAAAQSSSGVPEQVSGTLRGAQSGAPQTEDLVFERLDAANGVCMGEGRASSEKGKTENGRPAQGEEKMGHTVQGGEKVGHRVHREERLTGRVVCVFDNRGVGSSSCPVDPKAYRTDIMAEDALALADALGWKRFHVIGHSMGGMIACKLASAAPNRVISLSLISVSNGGYDCFPRLDYRPLRLVAKFFAAKTPEDRAHVDLETHFSMDFLSELVDGNPRRHHLHKEYVKTLSKNKGAMQPKHAQSGHLSACWNHGLTADDITHIYHADIPITVIHGSEDIVAHLSVGRKIAKRLHSVARFVELFGGHMIIREKCEEVNGALMELLDAADEGVKGRAWASADPHRKENDALLRKCDEDPSPSWLLLVSRCFWVLWRLCLMLAASAHMGCMMASQVLYTWTRPLFPTRQHYQSGYALIGGKGLRRANMGSSSV